MSAAKKLKTERPPVVFVDTEEAAAEALREIDALPFSTVFAVDSEFNKDDSIEIWSYSFGRGVRRVVTGEMLPLFAKWLSDKRRLLVYQSFAADCDKFLKAGVNVLRSFHADIMVMSWCCDENSKQHGLKEQSARCLHWFRKGYQDLFSYVPLGKKKPIVMQPWQVMRQLPRDLGVLLVVFTEEELQALDGCSEDEVWALGQERWRQRMIDYAGDDAESTWALYGHHRKQLEEEGYWETFLEMDKPFTLALWRCAERGIRLDVEILKKILRKVAIEELRITHAFRAFADKPEINLRSVQQLSKLFFEELGWPTRDDFRTENGAPQINEAALNWYIEEFDFTLAHLKLRFNEIATLRGTFLEGLINGVSEDGRMRSDFKQVGPNTGRIASRKKTVEVTETYTTKRGVEKERVRKEKQGANLQNIPTSRTDPYGIRGAFIAPAKGEFTADGTRAEEDYTLIVSDYTGFELYMAIYNAARFSPDSEMLTYARKGANLHAITAYRMGLIPREKRADVEAMIRDEEWSKLKKLVSAIESGRIYNSGKVCNFQLLYGGQAKLLCKKFGWDWRDRVNLRKADALIRAWGESWPEMPLYQKGIVAFGYQHGYVPTLAGARVHVREGLLHPDDGMRMHWERKCMNSPCQRSSAEIVKAAMILIDQDEELWELGARQLVQVHDEIVNEAPLRTAEPSQERIEHLMKNNRLSEKLGFPLVVEGKRAKSWLEAK